MFGVAQTTSAACRSFVAYDSPSKSALTWINADFRPPHQHALSHKIVSFARLYVLTVGLDDSWLGLRDCIGPSELDLLRRASPP